MNPKTQEAKTWQEVMEDFERAEHALEERDRSNGLVYSLDDENVRDFLENQCVDCHKNPHRFFVKKEAYRILYEALKALSDSQKRRIYRRFWEQKSYSEIARLEGVDESAVRRSVKRGLRQLKKKLAGTGVTANDFTERSSTRYVKHFHPKKENTDRQKNSTPLINLTGVPEKSKTFWGKEAQRNQRKMTVQSHFEEDGVCADAGGVADGE